MCGCGQRGCIEAYASGRNIQARAREELPSQPSYAIELAGGRREALDALFVGPKIGPASPPKSEAGPPPALPVSHQR